ncbi:hypothetical protein TIFTF001_017469 [Ficus carica]|uniref:Uncharacterized protein n=1 Tax=Ficus carica TaxID=3494 RepID=A0AA88AAP4_FICCA|nr:hypothetical protein TIFTF001_017469 [Ficus carica]
MHQKKSEAQIGKESTGISSDFNPNPHNNPFSSSSSSAIPIKTNQFHHKIHHLPPPYHPPQFSPPSPPPPPPQSQDLAVAIPPATPYKRPLLNPNNSSSLSKSPTLYKLRNDVVRRGSPSVVSAKAVVFRLVRRVNRLRRLVILLSLPFFYFLVSHPSHSFFLDFLSAFAFSAALLFSLNLALPRLPSIRLFLSRSLPLKLISPSSISRPPLPVFWSIGNRATRAEKRPNSGCWVQVYRNGDVYEGEFHKGKCSGSGVYYYYMSGRYEGNWVDEKYDGYGVETWARGSRYRGQYRQGLRHGFGVYRFYTGDVYAGEWSNGQSHGCGVHTCEDGSRYVGEFKWGVKHGLGHYHFRNGDTYAGEYFADKMHGFGVYQFAHGHRYEGAWHEGRRQGLGMYTFRNGETQSGHWQNGVLDIPSTQNTTYPVSPVAVYHSKVLNAVQEARRAAEKAYDVAKVDERVNRAVAAANRAANAARVAAVKAVIRRNKYTSHGNKKILAFAVFLFK